MENINVGIHNFFDIVVSDAETGEIKQKGKAYNILLNAFWAYFLSSSNASTLNYIHFGSGTAVPAATDTTLTTRIGGLVCLTDAIDDSTYLVDGVLKRKRSIRLEAGAYTGSTISEVGFASSSTTGLRTKALVKDQNGNPLSITIGATDVVDIYATFFAKVPMSIVNGTDGIKLGIDDLTKGLISLLLCKGMTFGINWRTAYSIGYSSPFSFLPRTNDYYTTTPSVSYDTSNKKITWSIPNVAAVNGNIGGFSSYSASDFCVKLPRLGFTQPVLTKEVIATGDGATKDFTCYFGRILDNGTAKLYVNDIEVPATFDYDMPKVPSNKYCSTHMRILSKVVGEIVWENPYNDKYGLATIIAETGTSTLYTSTDNVNWANLGTGKSFTITAEMQKNRYWKLTHATSQNLNTEIVSDSGWLDNKVIHASTAPPVGSTVALTYQPNCIAKDANHIINNASIVFAFNEYTPT